MPQKNKTNVGNPYVTRVDCRRTHEKIGLALWGSDGRGGMVKDIGNLTHDMKEVRNTLDAEKSIRKRKTELSNKWKLTIYGSIIGTCGLVCVEVIKLVAQAI